MIKKIFTSKTLALIILSIMAITYNQHAINQHYKPELHKFALIINISLLCYTIFHRNKLVNFNLYDITIGCFIIIIAITTYLNYTFKSDLDIIENVSYGILLYFPFRLATSNVDNEYLKDVVIPIFLVMVFIILTSAILTSESIRDIHGGMYNSTYFSNYISLFTPLLFLIFKTQEKGILKTTTILLIAFIITISFLNGSRSALFGLTLFFLVKINKEWIKQKAYYILSLGLIVMTALFYSITLKPNSVSGRFFIWKSGLEILIKNPAGIGLGNFKQELTVYQSNIIGKGVSKKQFLLSDINDYAFNDFLQYIIEGGIIMLAPLFLLLYLVLKSKCSQLRSFFLLIIVLASTSYILHSLLTLSIIVLTFCVFISIYRYPIVAYFSSPKLLLLSPIYLGIIWSSLAFASYKFNRNSPNISLLNQPLRSYRHLDNKYMYDWGMYNYQNKNYNQSIYLLRQSGMEDYNIDLNLALGASYEYLGDSRLAEKFYKKANTILPRIFKPKYYLFQFYATKKDTSNLKKISTEILKTPIKIPSSEITSLRKSAQQFLNKN